MTVLSFAHVNLRAPQPLLERLERFYVEVIGLQPGPRPPLRSRGYWLYAGGRDVLHLSEAAPGERRDGMGPGGFDHFALHCRGRGAVEERLRRHAVAFESVEVAQTGRLQLFLQDPAGNGVELSFERSDT